jgi:hypothetical protein
LLQKDCGSLDDDDDDDDDGDEEGVKRGIKGSLEQPSWRGGSIMNQNGIQTSYALITNKMFDVLQRSKCSEILISDSSCSSKGQDVSTRDPIAVVYGFNTASSSSSSSSSSSLFSSSLEGQGKSHEGLTTQRSTVMQEKGSSLRRRTTSPLSDLLACNAIKPLYDTLLTDGPVLSDKEKSPFAQHSLQLQESPLIGHLGNKCVQGALYCSYPQPCASPSLSLSPLGPKHLSNGEYCSTHHQTGQYSHRFAISPMKVDPIRTIMEDCQIGRLGIQTHDQRYDDGPDEVFHQDLCQWGATSPKCERYKTKPIANMKRSLIGSFEESLLSGRLLAGNHFQVI